MFPPLTPGIEQVSTHLTPTRARERTLACFRAGSAAHFRPWASVFPTCKMGRKDLLPLSLPALQVQIPSCFILFQKCPGDTSVPTAWDQHVPEGHSKGQWETVSWTDPLGDPRQQHSKGSDESGSKDIV